MAILYDCPVCDRQVGQHASTNSLARHVYRGDTPSLWLRPGERCPGGGVSIMAIMVAAPVPPRRPAYGDPEWLDSFGKIEWNPYRQGVALAALKEHLVMVTTARGNPFRVMTVS